MNGSKNFGALAVLSVAALISTAAAAEDVATLADVAWLSGCWSAEKGDAGSGEQWMPPAGGTMFGVSRTVKDGKTVAFEFTQLRLNADGKLVFIAFPSGQQETTFVASASGKDSITFENLQHDFPQRVIYRLQPAGRLVARIEGMRAGKLHGVDFPMRKVACEALRG